MRAGVYSTNLEDSWVPRRRVRDLLASAGCGGSPRLFTRSRPPCWSAAVVVALTRGDDDVKVEPAPPSRTPIAKATPAPTPPPAGKGLAVGVTEFNANLIASPEAKEVPEPWNAVRDKLGAIKPAYFRLVIDWASIQPSAETPAEPGFVAGRVHARGRALPGLGRGARAAAGAGVAAARGRVDGARGLHRHARVGGERGGRVRAPAGRSAVATAARGRAARLPAARPRRDQGGGAGGRAADLLQPLERAQPSGVHQPAARGVRPVVAEHRARRLRPDRAGAADRRWTRLPAISSSCWARRPG